MTSPGRFEIQHPAGAATTIPAPAPCPCDPAAHGELGRRIRVLERLAQHQAKQIESLVRILEGQ